MLRRTFLGAAGAVGAAMMERPARAAEGPAIRLGFDTYSLRGLKWEAMQLVEYAGSQKLDGIQISSLSDFKSLEPAYLRQVRRRAEELGLRIDGGIGCVCRHSSGWNARDGDPVAYLEKGLRAAHELGAKAMRCYLGGRPDRSGARPIEALMEEVIGSFRAVRAVAEDAQVKIALENHSGDLEADEVKTIIEEAGPSFVGSNLDSGNPMWLAEDPLYTLEVLGPYVVTTHIRDSALWEHPRGAAFEWVALGDGTMDLKKFIALYRKVCPQATMQLEIITGRRPAVLPHLEPDFWKALPKTRAAKFARFVELAKLGRPFAGFMVTEDGLRDAPAEYRAALVEQQKVDLERSLAYAKKELGAGARAEAG